MALAVARVDSEDGLLRLPRWWRKVAFVGIVAAYLAARGPGDWQLSYSPRNTLIAAACALALALVVLPAEAAQQSFFVRALEWRPLVFAGVISYSIFLWHEPLIRWLHGHGLTVGGGAGFLVNLVVVGIVTGLASALTYHFVEAPALRLKFRQRDRARQPVPAAQIEAAP
jgi:peptidoglycan/LPS O-acetylase OafA/YrhL